MSDNEISGNPGKPGLDASTCGARPKLLFVVTEDWYFVSHRLQLALAALNAGFDVALAARVAQHGSSIKKSGEHYFRSLFREGALN